MDQLVQNDRRGWFHEPSTRLAARKGIGSLDVSEVCGVLFIVVALTLGFGIFSRGPRLVAMLMLALTIGCVLFTRPGLLGRLRFPIWETAFVVLMFGSRWWTRNIFGWGDRFFDTLLPFVLMVVVVGTLTRRSVELGVTFGLGVCLFANLVSLVTNRAGATINVDLTTGVITPGWRLAFLHKNTLAMYSLVAIALSVAFVREKRVRTGLVVAWAGCVLASRSATGLAGLSILAYTGLVVFSVHRARWQSRLLVSSVLTAGAAVLATSVLELRASLLAAVGKDPTLTGRTEIWAAVKPMIAKQPYFGYGVGSLWTDQASEPTRTITRLAGFTFFHAHSSYYEVALQVGYIGVVLYSAALAAAIVGGLRAVSRVPRVAWAAISVGSLLAVLGVAETALFGGWPMIIALVTVVPLQHRQSVTDGGLLRLRRAAGLADPLPTEMALR